MKLFYIAIARLMTAGVLVTLAGSAAAQQAYPNKPIRIITPYAPGGATSILARMIAQKLTESWRQPVIVDNRPGGNTIIGTEALAKSPPDGYTIVLVLNTHAINASLYLKLPYDTLKDFAAIATVAKTELLLLVHPSVPANDLKTFIALAKSKPGELNYASSGSSGGPSHLATELLSIMAGIKMQHIPYKGGGPAVTDLLGGQVHLMFANPANVISHVKSGKLKAIAVSGESRLPALPQVPTFAEAGLPGFDVKAWFGFLAPAGTPKAIIDKLSTEITRILALPEFMEKLASQGTEPFISTPEQFVELMKADMARYAKIIKTANIKPEN